ncbi:hypothetical protein EK72_004532 [Salmonella enterica subsp. enterica]|nr:hypothetical protein [Salmonella enterica subsp. enterica]
MAKIIHTKLGHHRGSRRVWLEGSHLLNAGFYPGMKMASTPLSPYWITARLLFQDIRSNTRGASAPLLRNADSSYVDLPIAKRKGIILNLHIHYNGNLTLLYTVFVLHSPCHCFCNGGV